MKRAVNGPMEAAAPRGEMALAPAAQAPWGRGEGPGEGWSSLEFIIHEMGLSRSQAIRLLREKGFACTAEWR